jgi:chagasin family peptidase inhibitor I42
MTYEFGEADSSVRVPAGADFVIKLSDLAAPALWEMASVPANIKVVERDKAVPTIDPKSGNVGAGAAWWFRFRALSKGTGKLSFNRMKPPFEAPDDVKVFDVQVT